ncbi:hypothetical protein ACE45X_005371, partial [Escherichia coli]
MNRYLLAISAVNKQAFNTRNIRSRGGVDPLKKEKSGMLNNKKNRIIDNSEQVNKIIEGTNKLI